MEMHALVRGLFPPLAAAEYAALMADIAAQGQHAPIVVHDGAILDGWHRHRACRELGIAPITRAWDGEADDGALLRGALAFNARRRHLTPGQRALIAVALLPRLEAEAGARRRATLVQYHGTVGDERADPEIVPDRATDPVEGRGEAREVAAALVGTNPRYVGDAKRLHAEAPDLAERVWAGELSLPQALKALKLRPIITNDERVSRRTKPPRQHRARTVTRPADAIATALETLLGYDPKDVVTSLDADAIADLREQIDAARDLLDAIAAFLDDAATVRTVAEAECSNHDPWLQGGRMGGTVQTIASALVSR